MSGKTLSWCQIRRWSNNKNKRIFVYLSICSPVYESSTLFHTFSIVYPLYQLLLSLSLSHFYFLSSTVSYSILCITFYSLYQLLLSLYHLLSPSFCLSSLSLSLSVFPISIPLTWILPLLLFYSYTLLTTSLSLLIYLTYQLFP